MAVMRMTCVMVKKIITPPSPSPPLAPLSQCINHHHYKDKAYDEVYKHLWGSCHMPYRLTTFTPHSSRILHCSSCFFLLSSFRSFISTPPSLRFIFIQVPLAPFHSYSTFPFRLQLLHLTLHSVLPPTVREHYVLPFLATHSQYTLLIQWTWCGLQQILIRLQLVLSIFTTFTCHLYMSGHRVVTYISCIDI